MRVCASPCGIIPRFSQCCAPLDPHAVKTGWRLKCPLCTPPPPPPQKQKQADKAMLTPKTVMYHAMSTNPILSSAALPIWLDTCGGVHSRLRLAIEPWNACPLMASRQFWSSKVLVQIENNLERVATAEVWKWCRGLFKTDRGLQFSIRMT